MKRIVLALMALAMIMTGCGEKNKLTPNQQKLKSMDEMGVYALKVNNAPLVYDELTFQMAVSKSNLTTRLQLDDLSKILNIKFQGEPKINNEVVANITAIGVGGGITTVSAAKLTVLNIKDGKIWLSYDEKSIGYVMPWW